MTLMEASTGCAAVEKRQPTNVIEALACIMADLPAIAKVKHQTADGKGVTYAYRGIEEITAEAQGLFAKYCVIVAPKTSAREVRDITVNNNPWTDTYLECEWTIYGPGGIDDCIPASTFGVGRDNSDKGTNKAQTQGYKYLLLALLMISDPKDDNDGQTDEADAGTQSSQTHSSARSTNRTTSSGSLTEAQKKALEKIHTVRELDIFSTSMGRWQKKHDELTKAEASAWLDELNNPVPGGDS